MAGEVSGVVTVYDLVAPPQAMVAAVGTVYDLVAVPLAGVAAVGTVYDLVGVGGPGTVSGVSIVYDLVGSGAPGSASGVSIVFDLVRLPGVDPRVPSGVVIGSYQLDIVGAQDPDSPYTGPVCCEVHENVELEPVSGDDSHAVAVTIQIAPGATAVVSVRETEDVFGFEPDLEEVWFFYIESDPLSPGPVEFRNSAAGGWTDLIDGSTLLQPGGSIFFRGDEVQSWPAGAGSHQVEIHNPTGGTVTVTVCLAGAKTPPP